jgi:hypothetical protein
MYVRIRIFGGRKLKIRDAGAWRLERLETAESESCGARELPRHASVGRTGGLAVAASPPRGRACPHRARAAWPLLAVLGGSGSLYKSRGRHPHRHRRQRRQLHTAAVAASFACPPLFGAVPFSSSSRVRPRQPRGML